ncbi:MAG: phosphotransferase, partial [Actinomycetota bacterium]|nr:phosphotransferase [Actinomycetota bacterium]
LASGNPVAMAAEVPDAAVSPAAAKVRGYASHTAYGVGVSRSPAQLAALANSAVPGLDPVAARVAREVPGNRCEVAFVTDTQRRAWVIRVPTTPAVGAQLDGAAALLGLLGRRLPFAVPAPRGFVGVPEGRAVVYPYLHGRSVRLHEISGGPGVASEIGRALAALHNVDRAVFDEAGMPVYEAEAYRTRRLADLDRAAATGHVPTALLSRWERALEDVTAWRFAPTPVHGDLTGSRVLVSFAEEQDAATGTVRAVTGWELAKVADPADDLAVLQEECSPEAFESVMEAYGLTRIERPDRHLRLRARLASELRHLARLLDAVTASAPPLISLCATQLRALDERTAVEPDLVAPAPQLPQRPDVSTASSVADTDPQPARGDAAEEAGGHTQLLKTGASADATTVIPDDELDRLRSQASPSTERGTAAAAEAVSEADERWYQVVGPAPQTAPEPTLQPPSEPLSEPTSEPPSEASPESSHSASSDQAEEAR